MSERYISPKERGIKEGVNPSAKERPAEKPGGRRIGEQVPYPLPTEAEVARSLQKMERMSKGGAERGTERKREQEYSPMERIKNLGSMLGKNITGLRMLGPTGRKIGKGLLLAYAFGLAAETGAVWQAKNIHQANIEHKLKYGPLKPGSPGDKFARGEITHDAAIDQLVKRDTHLGFKAEGMRRGEGHSGVAGMETFVADKLNELGRKWAEMSVRGDKASEDVVSDEVVRFGVSIDEQIETAGDLYEK